MNDPKISRRRLLQGALASVAAVPAVLAARSAAAEVVAETDPTAQSLAYVSDAKRVNPKTNPTYKPGQTCANCLHYTGKPAPGDGPCAIFGNKSVKAAGWCKVWMLKPGTKVS